MTRTAAREIAVLLSFELGVNPGSGEEILETLFEPAYYDTLAAEDPVFSEYPDAEQLDYIRRLMLGVDGHLPELDSYIEKYAKKWKVGRISRLALAIMRVCMYEVLYMPDVPDSAAVNEAVVLAKKYEQRETAAFINGVLGSFVRGEKAAL